MVHIVFAVTILLALIGSMKRSRHIIWIAFFLLFAFAAPRYMFGNDYASYYQVHTRIINGGASPFGEEYLFTLLNMVCPSFFVLIAVTSGFFVFSIGRLLTKNLPLESVWLGVFIFVINPYIFLMNLSALRQCVAMIFLVFAVDAAYRRQLLRYCVLMAVGALFHKSMWLLMPLYIFINDKPFKVWTGWLILLGAVCLVFIVDLKDVSIWVAKLFDDPNYLHHVQHDVQNSLRATLLTGISFLYVLYNLPKLSGKPLVYGKLYLVSSFLGMLAYQVSMFTRIQMYFDVFSVVAIPAIIWDVQKRGHVIVRPDRPLTTMWDCVNKYAMPTLIIVVYCLRYYSFFTNPMWRSFFEYRTIFSGV